MSDRSDRIERAVYAALAQQLQRTDSAVRADAQLGLDRLGLDSHGLMRVLLDIERTLGLTDALELPDEALATPATLVSGVAAVIG